MFPDEESHFFTIQSGFEGVIFTLRCFKDFHVKEAEFLNQINNPRSRSGELFEKIADDFVDEFIF